MKRTLNTMLMFLVLVVSGTVQAAYAATSSAQAAQQMAGMNLDQNDESNSINQNDESNFIDELSGDGASESWAQLEDQDAADYAPVVKPVAQRAAAPAPLQTPTTRTQLTRSTIQPTRYSQQQQQAQLQSTQTLRGTAANVAHAATAQSIAQLAATDPNTAAALSQAHNQYLYAQQMGMSPADAMKQALMMSALTGIVQQTPNLIASGINAGVSGTKKAAGYVTQNSPTIISKVGDVASSAAGKARDLRLNIQTSYTPPVLTDDTDASVKAELAIINILATGKTITPAQTVMLQKMSIYELQDLLAHAAELYQQDFAVRSANKFKNDTSAAATFEKNYLNAMQTLIENLNKVLKNLSSKLGVTFTKTMPVEFEVHSMQQKAAASGPVNSDEDNKKYLHALEKRGILSRATSKEEIIDFMEKLASNHDAITGEDLNNFAKMDAADRAKIIDGKDATHVDSDGATTTIAKGLTAAQRAALVKLFKARNSDMDYAKKMGLTKGERRSKLWGRSYACEAAIEKAKTSPGNLNDHDFIALDEMNESEWNKMFTSKQRAAIIAQHRALMRMKIHTYPEQISVAAYSEMSIQDIKDVNNNFGRISDAQKAALTLRAVILASQVTSTVLKNKYGSTASRAGTNKADTIAQHDPTKLVPGDIANLSPEGMKSILTKVGSVELMEKLDTSAQKALIERAIQLVK